MWTLKHSIRLAVVVAALGGMAATLLFTRLSFLEPPWREERGASAYLGLVPYGGTRTADEITAARAIVDPLDQLQSIVRLEGDGLAIYLDAASSEPAVRLALRDATPAPAVASRTARPSAPGLSGLRVLLDPGHYGGTYAELEQRRFELPGGLVLEGNLNYATARLTAELLGAAGAEVRLTRGPPPETEFTPDARGLYDPRYEAALILGERIKQSGVAPWVERFPTLLSQWMLERERRRLVRELPYELFNHFDLRRRADLAEAWHPDVTLSLHFNLAARESINGIIVFAPGNFLAGELDTRTERLWGIRRVVDGTLPVTIELGRAVGWAMQRHLGLPTMPYDDNGDDTLSNKRPLDKPAGLFARNLAVLKRTPGPVLLVEGSCMNNPKETKRLVDTSLVVDGVGVPARLRDYAEAIVEALAQEAPTLFTHRYAVWGGPERVAPARPTQVVKATDRPPRRRRAQRDD